MGQTLSSPDTEKHKKEGGNDKFLYGICEMQGWRISMEDAHAIELNLENPKSGTNTFFAVYDGHGGGSVARFSGENVHKRLVTEKEYKREQYESALKKAFLGTDEDIRADSRFFRDPAGCTAVAALITHDNRIFVANAGDSRSVISVKGEVKPLSFDHKPLNESEITRIRNAGGYVEYGRVNGNLALSRALGDFEFKKNVALSPEEQIITANPDITEHQITEEDEFLILACDGIWDCLSSQQVVDIVRLKISEHKELSDISEFICDLCLAPDTSSGVGIGCDNMTILIVAILHGRTKNEWYDWVADRVKNEYGHKTPKEVPQIYSHSRLNAFRARRAAYEERMSRRHDGDDSPYSDLNDFGGIFGGRGVGPSPGALGFARAIFGGGGLSFYNPGPGPGAQPEDSSLSFNNDDSDEDSDEDFEMSQVERNENAARSFFASLGLRPPGGPSRDVTRDLREQLDELEDDRSTSRFEHIDEDDSEDNWGDAPSHPSDEAQQAFGAQPSRDQSGSPYEVNSTTSNRSGEAPPPPEPKVNGDIRVKQFSPHPSGDEAEPVVKDEGLMDTSEDPLKT